MNKDNEIKRKIELGWGRGDRKNYEKRIGREYLDMDYEEVEQ
jgi:hypothetical protein